jgi:plastocyanin
MHAIALHLVPVLAAEKNKAPFYVIAGLLAGWAVFVSLALGLRRADFPRSLTGERVVIAITALLVLATAVAAVATSGGSPEKAQPAAAQAPSPPATARTGGPPSSSPSRRSSTPARKAPRATTGTPTPPSSPAAATTALRLVANPSGQLSYDTKQLRARAGKVTITLTNSSPIEHDVAVAQGTKVLGATPVFAGGSRSITLHLKPGTYAFYCTVPGHRQAGMEGTLTVS